MGKVNGFTVRQLEVLQRVAPHLQGDRKLNCTQLHEVSKDRPYFMGLNQWIGFMNRLAKKGAVRRFYGPRNQTLWMLGPMYDKLVEDGIIKETP